MIYQNVELHNVAELLHNEDGSVSWLRVPQGVYDGLESELGRAMAGISTGVEMRFVLKGDQAVIRMATRSGDGVFHVFRGGIQGSSRDHEMQKLVGRDAGEFVIENSPYQEKLKIMTEKLGLGFDSEVIRIIFDRGRYKIFDIVGDVEPPKPEQCPQKTLLCYGSSITHGSNSLDMSHAWPSVLAHNLRMDVRNLGMAGSCEMEPEIIEYIAAEGEAGRWDAAILELGINVLTWEDEKILERVSHTISQIAGRNPQKPVVVISPFYYCGDDFESHGHGDRWRRLVRQVVAQLQLPNVTYINGRDVLTDMSYISADLVHPNILGVQRIADYLTAQLQTLL